MILEAAFALVTGLQGEGASGRGGRWLAVASHATRIGA